MVMRMRHLGIVGGPGVVKLDLREAPLAFSSAWVSQLYSKAFIWRGNNLGHWSLVIGGNVDAGGPRQVSWNSSI